MTAFVCITSNVRLMCYVDIVEVSCFFGLERDENKKHSLCKERRR